MVPLTKHALTGDYASYEDLFKEYERVTANLEYDKSWENEDMTIRKLLADIELKKEIETISKWDRKVRKESGDALRILLKK